MTGAPGEASAIVLAGGRSQRFGSDKMGVDLGGAPLLHHALRAVATSCDEVVVVLASGGSAPSLPVDIGRRVRVVRDASDHPGPLVALITGVRAATNTRALIVAGDMPTLQPAVLSRLLGWVHGDGACLLVEGERQVLPIALDREACVAEGDRLVAAGERSLRTLIARLELERIEESEWRALDPTGASLRDVDRPDDLSRVRQASMGADP
jgi:molybdopterin-guanine dinucleotide biosynthesis protein A